MHVNIEKGRTECDIKPEFKRTNRRLRCLAQRRTVPRYTRIEERSYKIHASFQFRFSYVNKGYIIIFNKSSIVCMPTVFEIK